MHTEGYKDRPVCDLCGKDFGCAQALFNHKAKQHEGKITWHQCDICGEYEIV